MIEFIRNVKFQLKSIVEKHLYKGSCSFLKRGKILIVEYRLFQNPTFLFYFENPKSLSQKTNYCWIHLDPYTSIYFRGTFFKGILQ